jgi:hypothetical protein
MMEPFQSRTSAASDTQPKSSSSPILSGRDASSQLGDPEVATGRGTASESVPSLVATDIERSPDPVALHTHVKESPAETTPPFMAAEDATTLQFNFYLEKLTFNDLPQHSAEVKKIDRPLNTDGGTIKLRELCFYEVMFFFNPLHFWFAMLKF